MRYGHFLLAFGLAGGLIGACTGGSPAGFSGADGGPGSGATTDGSFPGSSPDGSGPQATDGGSPVGTSEGGGGPTGAPSGPPFYFDGGWHIPDSGYTPPFVGDGGTSTVIGPGASSSAPGDFGGTTDPTASPTIVYPPDGVLLPPNTYGLEFHFIPAAGQTLFRFTFQAASTTLLVYTGCTAVGAGCVFTPDASFWSLLVSYARGGAPLTFSLSGVNGSTPGEVGTSASQTIAFSDQDITGGLYYWNTLGVIQRYDFAAPDAGVENYLIASDVGALVCVGCHAISRPGNRIAVGKDIPAPTGDSVLEVPTKGSLLSQTLPAAANFFSFSPDEWHLLESNGGGISWVELGTGKVNANIVAGTMPDWSPDGLHMVYAQSSEMNPTGIQSGSISTMHFNGTTWDTPATIVQQTTENNYYPAYSPDGAWVAFDRSPGNHESFSNASPDEDAGTVPDGELWVVAASGGTPVRLSTASNPGALSWPKWAPVEHDYYGGKIMWITFSSLRAYGLRLSAGEQTQLWMVAVDLTKLGSGTDPSFPAFWLPFQDISGGNHIAQWSTAVVRASCSGGTECPTRESCIDGTCQQE
jgi:TolB protein